MYEEDHELRDVMLERRALEFLLAHACETLLFYADRGNYNAADDGMEDAAIYKVALDGKVLGKFGKAGKMPKEFGVANSIDCRSENELLVGEMTNWRVQKVTLKK